MSEFKGSKVIVGLSANRSETDAVFFVPDMDFARVLAAKEADAPRVYEEVTRQNQITGRDGELLAGAWAQKGEEGPLTHLLRGEGVSFLCEYKPRNVETSFYGTKMFGQGRFTFMARQDAAPHNKYYVTVIRE